MAMTTHDSSRKHGHRYNTTRDMTNPHEIG